MSVCVLVDVGFGETLTFIFLPLDFSSFDRRCFDFLSFCSRIRICLVVSESDSPEDELDSEGIGEVLGLGMGLFSRLSVV